MKVIKREKQIARKWRERANPLVDGGEKPRPLSHAARHRTFDSRMLSSCYKVTFTLLCTE